MEIVLIFKFYDLFKKNICTAKIFSIYN